MAKVTQLAISISSAVAATSSLILLVVAIRKLVLLIDRWLPRSPPFNALQSTRNLIATLCLYFMAQPLFFPLLVALLVSARPVIWGITFATFVNGRPPLFMCYENGRGRMGRKDVRLLSLGGETEGGSIASLIRRNNDGSQRPITLLIAIKLLLYLLELINRIDNFYFCTFLWCLGPEEWIIIFRWQQNKRATISDDIYCSQSMIYSDLVGLKSNLVKIPLVSKCL